MRLKATSMALAVLTAVAVGGCGQSPETIACDQVAGVRSAIEDLRNVNLGENGMVALESGLAQLKTELDTLRGEVSAAAQPQVDAMTTSVQQLRASVQNARANPTTASLSVVENALQSARASAQNLATAVAPDC
jgi:hypothetical protein